MVGSNNFFCLLMFLHFRILISEKQSLSKNYLLEHKKKSQMDLHHGELENAWINPLQVFVSVDTKILENNYYCKISG